MPDIKYFFDVCQPAFEKPSSSGFFSIKTDTIWPFKKNLFFDKELENQQYERSNVTVINGKLIDAYYLTLLEF